MLFLSLLPALVGWYILNRDRGHGPTWRHATATLVGLTLLSAGSGGWALQPPADNPFTTVVFRGGAVPGQVEEAWGPFTHAWSGPPPTWVLL